MALEVILVICCILCICVSSLAGAFIFPPPETTTSDYDGYKKVATGRVVYDRVNAPSETDEALCALGCTTDFTCKGFNSWKTGTGFLETSHCLQQKAEVNPWFTVPAWLMKKPNTANIFVKST